MSYTTSPPQDRPHLQPASTSSARLNVAHISSPHQHRFRQQARAPGLVWQSLEIALFDLKKRFKMVKSCKFGP